MLGTEHFAEAERLLNLAQKTSEDVAQLTVGDHTGVARIMNTLLLRAQVHATLALAAATKPEYERDGLV